MNKLLLRATEKRKSAKFEGNEVTGAYSIYSPLCPVTMFYYLHISVHRAVAATRCDAVRYTDGYLNLSVRIAQCLVSSMVKSS